MATDPFIHLDATDQARLVREGQATARELADAAIARIERLNPRLNAVVTPLFEAARESAAGPLPPGPFAGVPYLFKDVLARLAGVRATAGSAALASNVDERDSEVVRRTRATGVVVLGKTNTPELGLLPTTEPALFGPARNPWNTALTPGGSSGGAAAAVAARLVPFAHASDGGGSIRLPAACCGLFGLKPSRGRVPLGPDRSDVFGIVAEHAITISVRDSAALLDATAGPMPGEAHACPAPERAFAAEIGRPPGRLRIAWSAAAPAGTPVDPACAEAVADAARLCAALGHDVVEAAPAFDGARLYATFVELWAVGCAAAVEALIETRGRDAVVPRLESFTRQLWERGSRVSAVAHVRGRESLAGVARRLARFLETYDLWLTPTLGHRPPPIGHFGHLSDHADAVLARSAAFVPWTPLANVAGFPAMSVPLRWSEDGVPLGVHFMARFGEEATLLRLASQLEHARPWAARLPELAGEPGQDLARRSRP